MRKLFFVIAACSVLVSAPGAAQAPAPAPTPAPRQPAAGPAGQQPPLTFKVEVNYVEVDAVVTDAQGHFVPDLTKNDFQVTEDGKPQTLSVFSRVDIPIEHVDPPLFSKNEIPPDVATNATPFEGRVFVLVLDDLHTRFSRTARTRAAARLFVERYVGANDMVAVVNTSGASGAMQDFTANRALALRAIDRALGSKADSAMSAQLDDYYQTQGMPAGAGMNANAMSNELERYSKARNTLRTLRSLSDYLAGIRGRRKAVVFFSEGIDYDLNNPMQNRYASDLQEDMKDVVAAATHGNVSIYSVDPRGVTSLGDEMMDIQSIPTDNSISTTQLLDELRVQQDSLRYVADQTGGLAVLNQNDFRTGFSRILDQNSNYYVLGYYPTNDKHDGRFRRVQVHVSRPGLTVHTRSGYVAPSKKADAAAKAAEGTSDELRDALDSPLPMSGLTLHVFAAPFRGPAPKDAVALSIQVDGSKLPFKKAGELFTDDLEVSLFASNSATGKVADGAHDVVKLTLKPQTYQLVSTGGFRIVRRLMLTPGRYQLRVGARESNGGTVGSVIDDLDVPDFTKGPLTMSGIMITSAAASRTPTASPDQSVNEFKQLLPAPPAALRDFPQGDQLAIFTEIYDNLGKAPHRVAITASVLDDGGKVVFTTSDERKSDELQGASGGYGYTTRIPLTGMAPGRYVLRVEGKSLMGKGESVMREVEFRVR